MNRSDFKRRLPGTIATGLVVLTTGFWTFWGVAEMYYEARGLPFPRLLAYLTLAALTGLHGERMMMVLNATLPGLSVSTHSHPHEQIGMVYRGRAILRIGDEERQVGPGDFYCIPSGVPHSDTCLGDEPFVMLDIFYPVRESFLRRVRKGSGLRGAILIFPGVEELDFVGVYEVLAKARARPNEFGTAAEGVLAVERPIEVLLLARERWVVCANGLEVQPHQRYAGLAGFDFIVVPGGQGVQALREDEALLDDLSRFHDGGGLLCSVCTGALVLAWAGVLEGRRATTHHAHREKLAPYCQVVDQRVVADGNVVTAAGVSASLDLGLALLQRFYGSEAAHQVAGRIEYCW